MIQAWKQCRQIMQHFSDHYAASEAQQFALFKLAMSLPMPDPKNSTPGARRRSSLIVELGVCNGRTAAMFAFTTRYTRARYVGIDNFCLEGSADWIRGAFKDLKLTGIIIEATTQETGAVWKDPIDILFIDAGHDEANVKPDIELWVPKVDVGGYVIFHDWDEVYSRESAHWAIRYYGEKSVEETAERKWKVVPGPGGMAVYRRIR